MVYRFAVDIGATRTMLALVEAFRPEIVAYDRPLTEVLFTGQRPPSQALADAISEFLRRRRVEATELLGVGVGIPGVVDRTTGTVISCPNLPVLNGAALGAETSEELGAPVCPANNTNLIALGEHTAGLGQGVNDMAVVFVGSGVGCGLILNGQLYEGANGAAAELGHTIVAPNGLACSCGSHGCLEMYCSGKALTMVAEQMFKPGDLYALGARFAGAQLLIEQARAGHAKALEALTTAFTYLAASLTSLVNLLNPRLVVLGGGICFAWPEGVDIVRQTVMREALPSARRDLRIEMSQLGNYAGVLGGAALVTAACGQSLPASH